MKKAVLLLTLLTGFSGLVFQVVWQKYFSYFLGGEALASALVVSIFLGGLSCGYAWFGKLAIGKSEDALLKMAGLAELGIGIYAFVFPFIFEFLWNHMGALPIGQPTRILVDVFITTVLLSPSTILMGSTLPLLTRGLSSQDSELSTIHSRVYGLNTLGAFFGALISGFFLIRLLGLPYSLMTLSACNILAGLTMLYYAKKVVRRPTKISGQKIPSLAQSTPVSALALAFLSGFVCVGFEIVFIRSVNLAIGTSEYSYSLVVGVFVLMIALGTLSLRWKRPSGQHRLLVNQMGIICGLLAVFLSVPYWGWLSYVVGASVAANFYIYYAAIFTVYSLIIAVPVFYMGRTMPLLFAYLDSGVAGAASTVGRIYAANTVGCCFGGLVMGYTMFLFMDADMVFRFGILLSCLSLILISVFLKGQMARRWLPWALSAALAMVAITVPSWSRSLMTGGLFRAHRMLPVAFSDPILFLQKVEESKKVVMYRDDPNMNVSVLEWPTGERSLYVNGKSDGSTSNADLMTTFLLGHLPGLFAGSDGNAAVVGLGLGTTAHVIAKYPNIFHVDVFEIAGAVISAQGLFAQVNGDPLHDPKITIHQMDAFHGLLSAPTQYAAVTAESSNPWVAGSDRLYSTEFYLAVKDKLLPGGVFAQWMHTYEMSFDTFGIVMRTFQTAFPYVRMFSNATDLIMVGKATPWTAENQQRAERRWNDLHVGDEMAKVGVGTFNELAAHEVFFTADLNQYPWHSLFTPKLAFAAGEDFFYGRGFTLSERKPAEQVDPLGN